MDHRDRVRRWGVLYKEGSPVRGWTWAVFLPIAVLILSCGGGSDSPAPPPEMEFQEPLVLFTGEPLGIEPVEALSAILIETSTNTVIYDQAAHLPRPPASIVKLTLELVAMHEIEAGRLALDDTVTTSAWASRIGGSQVYLAEGERFTVEELLKAIVIHSANDACVALAEHISGTDAGFVMLMNREAEALGLADTRYINVHGLDDEPGDQNQSTAYDIAQVGRALIRFPHVLEWSSIEVAPFRDGAFELRNRNKLVGRFPGLDGLKTGFTNKAGHCLCATAERNDLRLISVVLGVESDRKRFQESARLLSAGFNSYLPVRICEPGDTLEAAVGVPGSGSGTVAAVTDREVTLIVSRPEDRDLVHEFIPREDLKAPLLAGDPLGVCQVRSGSRVLAEFPVVTPVRVEASGLGARIKRLFGGGA